MVTTDTGSRYTFSIKNFFFKRTPSVQLKHHTTYFNDTLTRKPNILTRSKSLESLYTSGIDNKAFPSPNRMSWQTSDILHGLKGDLKLSRDLIHHRIKPRRKLRDYFLSRSNKNDDIFGICDTSINGRLGSSGDDTHSGMQEELEYKERYEKTVVTDSFTEHITREERWSVGGAKAEEIVIDVSRNTNFDPQRNCSENDTVNIPESSQTDSKTAHVDTGTFVGMDSDTRNNNVKLSGDNVKLTEYDIKAIDNAIVPSDNTQMTNDNTDPCIDHSELTGNDEDISVDGMGSSLYDTELSGESIESFHNNTPSSEDNMELACHDAKTSGDNCKSTCNKINHCVENLSLSVDNRELFAENVEFSVGNTESLVGEVELPGSNVEPSVEIEESPADYADNVDPVWLGENVNSLRENVEFPSEHRESSVENVELPSEDMESSVENVDLPREHMESSIEHVESSVDIMERSEAYIEPEENVEEIHEQKEAFGNSLDCLKDNGKLLLDEADRVVLSNNCMMVSVGKEDTLAYSTNLIIEGMEHDTKTTTSFEESKFSDPCGDEMKVPEDNEITRLVNIETIGAAESSLCKSMPVEKRLDTQNTMLGETQECEGEVDVTENDDFNFLVFNNGYVMCKMISPADRNSATFAGLHHSPVEHGLEYLDVVDGRITFKTLHNEDDVDLLERNVPLYIKNMFKRFEKRMEENDDMFIGLSALFDCFDEENVCQ